jgi:hypothetical protein
MLAGKRLWARVGVSTEAWIIFHAFLRPLKPNFSFKSALLNTNLAQTFFGLEHQAKSLKVCECENTSDFSKKLIYAYVK